MVDPIGQNSWMMASPPTVALGHVTRKFNVNLRDAARKEFVFEVKPLSILRDEPNEALSFNTRYMPRQLVQSMAAPTAKVRKVDGPGRTRELGLYLIA